MGLSFMVWLTKQLVVGPRRMLYLEKMRCFGPNLRNTHQHQMMIGLTWLKLNFSEKKCLDIHWIEKNVRNVDTLVDEHNSFSMFVFYNLLFLVVKFCPPVIDSVHECGSIHGSDLMTEAVSDCRTFWLINPSFASPDNPRTNLLWDLCPYWC